MTPNHLPFLSILGYAKAVSSQQETNSLCYQETFPSQAQNVRILISSKASPISCEWREVLSQPLRALCFPPFVM